MKRKETNRTPICIQFERKYSFNFIKGYLEEHLFDELHVSRLLLFIREKKYN